MSLPLLGSGISLLWTSKNAISQPHKAMEKLCKKYGNIMSVGLGIDQWIVLSGFEEIKNFSMRSEGISRPVMKNLNQLYCYDKDTGLGVIFASGAIWQEQRKFMAKALKEMSVGSQSFEEHIFNEMEMFSQYLQTECAKQSVEHFDGKNFFDIATLNIIWRLAASHRFDYNDDLTKEMIQHVEAFTMEPFLGIVGTVKYAKDLPYLSRIYANVSTHMTTFKNQIEHFLKAASEDESCYVSRFESAKLALGSDENSSFSTQQLIVSLLDFFTGGSGTVSKTLSFCILYMLHYPEWQETIRKEHSEDSDKNLTEAFIMEVQRLCSILPISPPRMVTQDFEFYQYKLKKGQKVQMNLYAMHRNESHWGPDANEFRPQRFLDQDGNVKHDDWLQPYGYGKRKCLGEKVADNTIRIFLTNLIQQFQFSKVDGLPLPDTETVGGLTLMPKDFRVQVTPLN